MGEYNYNLNLCFVGKRRYIFLMINLSHTPTSNKNSKIPNLMAIDGALLHLVNSQSIIYLSDKSPYEIKGYPCSIAKCQA